MSQIVKAMRRAEMSVRKIFLGAAIALYSVASSAFFVGPIPDPQRTTVYEYWNEITGHYFLAADAIEENAVDSGAAGPGWHRTGFNFAAYIPNAHRAAGEVCRFYAPSPNTHFYSASPFECQLLLDHPEYGWISEGIKFEIAVPSGGTCASGVTVHRYYNNRFAFNDSNHRYVFDPAVGAEMVSLGWIDEGAVFCPETGARSPRVCLHDILRCDGAQHAHQGGLRERGHQQDGMRRRRRHAGLVSQPDRSVLSPFLRRPETALVRSVQRDHGRLVRHLHLMDPNDGNAVAAHSFVEPYGAFGFHLSSLDATAQIASMDSIYQLKTRAPLPGTTEARVFPWRLGLDNYLDLAFSVNAPTVARSTGSHAWGSPMIEFRDTVSGQSIDVTLQAFGTIPPGDFSGVMEPETGNVFVSTVFRADPQFGIRLRGDFMPCNTGPCGSGDFAFRLRREDFENVIAIARGSNPALSQNATDYILVNFRFRMGIFGQAELGASLSSLFLSVY